MLLDCISRIVLGTGFAVTAYSHDVEELRKRITSLVLAGDSLVLFDNLEGKFGNAALDAALTATIWKDRLLGTNQRLEGRLAITWYATGNNVLIHADTARRICHIRLESPHEKPEERTDIRRPDLLRWVLEERPRLLRNALTILRAYVVAGKPRMLMKSWGSFESWSDWVRGAIVWCGFPDPVESRRELQEQSDTSASAMGQLLRALEAIDPDRLGLTTGEIVSHATRPDSPHSSEIQEMLLEGINGICAKLDGRLLGYRLRHYRRRVFDGRFIDLASMKSGNNRWAVYPAKEFHSSVEPSPLSPPCPPNETFEEVETVDMVDKVDIFSSLSDADSPNDNRSESSFIPKSFAFSEQTDSEDRVEI
jgi:hypothetical protein